jgi:hypothetical protein
MKKLLTVMGGKFEFSAQGSDLAPFVGNGTKIKIHSEIKQPLEPTLCKKNQILFISSYFLCFSVLNIIHYIFSGKNLKQLCGNLVLVYHDFSK